MQDEQRTFQKITRYLEPKVKIKEKFFLFPSCTKFFAFY